jgi:hypothetical protein
MLFPQLSSKKMQLLNDIENLSKQIKIFKWIQKDDLIYSEFHSILVSQSGVSSYIRSYQPALLKCVDWSYREEDFTINFKIVATEDSTPYSAPYQNQYSGIHAILHVPFLSDTATNAYEKIRNITKEDLPLFINYKHKTQLYSNLFI